MAGLHRLFDHPFVLVDGPSPRARLARKRTLALPRTRSRLDRDVDRYRRAHRDVAPRQALLDLAGVDSGCISLRRRHLHLTHAGAHFSWAQLGGLPEVRPRDARSSHNNNRLVTTGIRARVRHPVYLAHLCEMLAWSIGTGLIVCWLLTAFAVVTGAVMIRMEDAELECRFGEVYAAYKLRVPAVLPSLRNVPPFHERRRE